MSQAFWKKCSNCKVALPFGKAYQACSVSTCNHVRSGLQFCSVSCWSAHVPVYRHKQAWAIEKIAPLESEVAEIQSASVANESVTVAPKRILVSASSTTPVRSKAEEEEILVVISKLKGYISKRSDYNTSADVMDKLSDILRDLCDKAIENARNDGRKTVMARDF